MISVEEAARQILAHRYPPVKEVVRLHDAVGRVLAQEVVADRHFPPFDRVTMDGITFSFSTWAGGQRSFPLAGTQFAGEKGKTLPDENSAFEVMTGAVLPVGCDTVVPYEEVTINENIATVQGEVRQGQNIHRTGRDQEKGTVLLRKGVRLTPSEIAVLATVGVAEPEVYRLPKVAVIATGDELVPVGRQPEAYQIRSSNSEALAAALADWKIEAGVFHLKDDKAALAKDLSEILKNYEVLLLSGGVSKGKADYLPEVLESVGIRNIFHKVAQRPGKPLWFGTTQQRFVFAFPGNPVSTFMCFHRYFVPWLRACLDLPATVEFARLSEDFTFPSPLTYFLQVKAGIDKKGEVWAAPRSGGGSGDLANLLFANAFLELPPDKKEFKKGDAFPLIRFNAFHQQY